MSPALCLKVLQIGLEWFPEHGGGLDRYFHGLLAHGGAVGLEQRGLVVGGPAAAIATDGRVRAFASRDQSLPRRLGGARRAIGEAMSTFRPDLVASHFALHAAPALKRLDRPLVVHFQGPWSDESAAQGQSFLTAAIKRAIEGRVYRRAVRCIVLSTPFADLLARDFGVDPGRIEVIPPSIDVDRFAIPGLDRAAARAALGWPTDRPVLLAVRRLVRRMGLESLVDAVATVTPAYPDLLLMIAGRGPEHDALARRIDDHGLRNNIRLLGYVADDDLPLAYRAADLTIVPTEALEGFGLITAESLAAGTPVMVTPVGGLPEAVQPLSSRLVLDGVTAEHLAAGLKNWMAGRLSLPDDDACRRYARERFAWSVGAERIAAVYARAVTDR